jgi:hypothetical protein
LPIETRPIRIIEYATEAAKAEPGHSPVAQKEAVEAIHSGYMGLGLRSVGIENQADARPIIDLLRPELYRNRQHHRAAISWAEMSANLRNGYVEFLQPGQQRGGWTETGLTLANRFGPATLEYGHTDARKVLQ